MEKLQKRFDLIFFILSLIGVIITIHLYIMDNRGFDRGCLGFTTSQTIEAAFDCESVLDSEMGQILGISNVYWGITFYLCLVFIHLILFFGSKHIQKIVKVVRILAISCGLFYSVFLVYYQKTVLDEYCALCLMSATTVLLLSITQILYINKFSFFSEIGSSIPIKPIVILSGLTILISASDYLYFQSLESEKIVEEPHIIQPHQEKIETPVIHENHKQNNPVIGECKYDDTRSITGDYLDLIHENDFKTGNSGAKNLVIELFDPNCLYCKRLSSVMKEFVEKYRSEAYFVFKPIPLWSYSIIQIQALYIAGESGLFMEMLEEQFNRQIPHKGLSLNEIKEIAYNLGIDGHLMVQRIQNNDYRKFIFEEHKKTRAAGIKSAPTLMINGKIVDTKSRTIQCLGELIRE